MANGQKYNLTPEKLREMILAKADLGSDIAVQEFSSIFTNYIVSEKGGAFGKEIAFSEQELETFAKFAKIIKQGECTPEEAAVQAGLQAPSGAHVPHDPSRARYPDSVAMQMIMEQAPGATEEQINNYFLGATRTDPTTISQHQINDIVAGIKHQQWENTPFDVDNAVSQIRQRLPDADPWTAASMLKKIAVRINPTMPGQASSVVVTGKQIEEVISEITNPPKPNLKILSRAEMFENAFDPAPQGAPQDLESQVSGSDSAPNASRILPFAQAVEELAISYVSMSLVESGKRKESVWAPATPKTIEAAIRKSGRVTGDGKFEKVDLDEVVASIDANSDFINVTKSEKDVLNKIYHTSGLDKGSRFKDREAVANLYRRLKNPHSPKAVSLLVAYSIKLFESNFARVGRDLEKMLNPPGYTAKPMRGEDYEQMLGAAPSKRIFTYFREKIAGAYRSWAESRKEKKAEKQRLKEERKKQAVDMLAAKLQAVDEARKAESAAKKYVLPAGCVDSADELVSQIAARGGYPDEGAYAHIKSAFADYCIAPRMRIITDSDGIAVVVLDIEGTEKAANPLMMAGKKLAIKDLEIKTLDNAIDSWIAQFSIPEGEQELFRYAAKSYAEMIAPIYDQKEENKPKLSGVNPHGEMFVSMGLGGIISAAIAASRQPAASTSAVYVPVDMSQIRRRCYDELGASEDEEAGLNMIIDNVISDFGLSVAEGAQGSIIHLEQRGMDETLGRIIVRCAEEYMGEKSAGRKAPLAGGIMPPVIEGVQTAPEAVSAGAAPTMQLPVASVPADWIPFDDAAGELAQHYGVFSSSGELKAVSIDEAKDTIKDANRVRKGNDGKDYVARRDLESIAKVRSRWVDVDKESARVRKAMGSVVDQAKEAHALLVKYLGDPSNKENLQAAEAFCGFIRTRKDYAVTETPKKKGGKIDPTNPYDLARVQANREYQERINDPNLPIVDLLAHYIARHDKEVELLNAEYIHILPQLDEAKRDIEEIKGQYDSAKAESERLMEENKDILSERDSARALYRKEAEDHRRFRRKVYARVAAAVILAASVGSAFGVPKIIDYVNLKMAEAAQNKAQLERMDTALQTFNSGIEDAAARIRGDYRNK